MPVATKFMTDGVGNGFPSCLTKVNVSTYDKWTTFSGWSKDSEPAGGAAKVESIARSLAAAMKIYWNLYSVNGTLTATGTDPNESVSLSSVNVSTDPKAQPSSRVCHWLDDVSESDSDGGISCAFDIYSRSSGGEIQIPIARLYAGNTSIESNFIGYGMLEDLDGRLTRISTSTGSTVIQISLWSMLNESSDDSDEFRDYAYVELNGIYFVAYCYARNNDIGSGSVSLDASTLSAYTLYDSTFGRQESEGQITSLDFYTYPA